jgi:hypothetical protein
MFAGVSRETKLLGFQLTMAASHPRQAQSDLHKIIAAIGASVGRRHCCFGTGPPKVPAANPGSERRIGRLMAFTRRVLNTALRSTAIKEGSRQAVQH